VHGAGAVPAQAVPSPVLALSGGEMGPSQLHGLLTGGVLGSGDDWDGTDQTGRGREGRLGGNLLLVRPLPLAFPVTLIEDDGLGDELVQGDRTLPPGQSVLHGLPQTTSECDIQRKLVPGATGCKYAKLA